MIVFNVLDVHHSDYAEYGRQLKKISAPELFDFLNIRT